MQPSAVVKEREQLAKIKQKRNKEVLQEMLEEERAQRQSPKSSSAGHGEGQGGTSMADGQAAAEPMDHPADAKDTKDRPTDLLQRKVCTNPKGAVAWR